MSYGFWQIACSRVPFSFHCWPVLKELVKSSHIFQTMLAYLPAIMRVTIIAVSIVMCNAESEALASKSSLCWCSIPDQDKALCANVERSSDYSADSTMPYFMGDVLHHLMDSKDQFLQISEERNTASYLSTCADRFSENFSLKVSQLPTFSWPPNLRQRQNFSPRLLPQAKYYFAHILVRQLSSVGLVIYVKRCCIIQLNFSCFDKLLYLL
jgi:hypothetical protein